MEELSRILTQAAGELIAPTTAAYALAAIGLNMHFGYTGLLNMGQAGFMLLGAYGFAISTIAGAPFLLAVLVALAASIVFALILGIPTLQLRGDYLAIVTIAAAEIVRLRRPLQRAHGVDRRPAGLRGRVQGHVRRALAPARRPHRHRPSSTSTAARTPGGSGSSAGASSRWRCIFVWLLMRSPWGRVLKGIREDENAVRALGKNVYSYKMQALILGGVLGALGGMIFMLPRVPSSPPSTATPMTFFLYDLLLLGGAATVLARSSAR